MYFIPIYPYYLVDLSQGYRGWPLYQYHPFLHENGNQMFNHTMEKNGLQVNGQLERQSMDHGPQPYVVNIHEAARRNNTFRTVICTGSHLQVVVMSIQPGEDIGLEVHQTHDQFLRIEEGEGITRMGTSKQNLNFAERISRGSAIMVPAGTWHNIINTGNQPLKLYTIYGPPEHAYGTVHETKQAALAAEANH